MTINAEVVALTPDNPRIATPNFYNRTGSGADGWKSLGYPQYASAYDLGLQWNDLRFANIDTDNPDLSGLRDSGHKILHYHGLADTASQWQVRQPINRNSVARWTRYEPWLGPMIAAMGGMAELQKFARFYPIPGHAHTSSFNFSGQYDKTDPTKMVSANLVPMPQGSNNPVDQTQQGRDELFKALTNWVEGGVAPGSIEVASLDGSVRMPLCVYPTRIAVKAGATDLKSAASYECK